MKLNEEAVFSLTEKKDTLRVTLLLRLVAVVVVIIALPLRAALPLWMAEIFHLIAYPLLLYNLLFLVFYRQIALFLKKRSFFLFFDLVIAIGLLQIGGGWRSSYFVYTLTSIILFTIFEGRRGAYISSVILFLAALIKDPAGNILSMEVFNVTNLDMRVGASLFYITAGFILGYFDTLLKKIEMLSKMQEKVQLSRKLHDGVKQMILAILLKLNPLVKKAVSGKDEMSGELEKIWRWMNYLQRELSCIVELLNTEGPAEKTICKLKTIAEEEAKIVQGITEFIWYISSKHSVILISPDSQEHIRYFFSESLMNAWKHSGVTSGTIDLDYSDNIITITVSDQGKGFTYSKNEHFKTMGIKNLKYRAEELRGELTINTAPGRGCKVILTFPTADI